MAKKGKKEIAGLFEKDLCKRTDYAKKLPGMLYMMWYKNNADDLCDMPKRKILGELEIALSSMEQLRNMQRNVLVEVLSALMKTENYNWQDALSHSEHLRKFNIPVEPVYNKKQEVYYNPVMK